MGSFDVAVIGAGPGGYIAAIRAAQLGFKVACIDQWKNAKGGPAPGGTCTNIGCIPSKALLQSSENFEHAVKHFAEHGIVLSGAPTIDVARMLARKDRVVAQNNEGILYLFKKNKVTFLHGTGAFVGRDGDGYAIKVSAPADETLTAKHVIIATGSNARPLPGVAFDAGGYRLGYGQGYYDRFLPQTRAVTVGLAYAFQLCPTVYPAPHDCRLHLVVTEEGSM